MRSGINLPISFHEQLIGVVGITGEPEEVRAYAELVKMAAELVIEHMVLIEQRQWDKRYREELINQLILRENSTESLRSMAAYLGIDLAVPRVVLIIELSQPDREALRNVMDYFENHARNHLVTFTEFNELIIIKPITLKEESGIPAEKWANCRFLNHGLHHRALAVFWLGVILPARRDCTDLCSLREPRRRWRNKSCAASTFLS